MNIKPQAALLVATCFLPLCGCGRQPSLILEGTAGSLTAGNTRLPDFEIKIHQAGNPLPFGVGITGSDGSFHLSSPNGEGPLRLPPGNYVVTLESVGPATPRISSSYANAFKSPLKLNWKSSDQSLELKLPAIK